MFEQEDTKPGLSTSFAIEQGLRAASEIGEDQLTRISPTLREAFSATSLALLYVADLIQMELGAADATSKAPTETTAEARKRFEGTVVQQLKRAIDSIEKK